MCTAILQAEKVSFFFWWRNLVTPLGWSGTRGWPGWHFNLLKEKMWAKFRSIKFRYQALRPLLAHVGTFNSSSFRAVLIGLQGSCVVYPHVSRSWLSHGPLDGERWWVIGYCTSCVAPPEWRLYLRYEVGKVPEVPWLKCVLPGMAPKHPTSELRVGMRVASTKLETTSRAALWRNLEGPISLSHWQSWKNPGLNNPG